MTNLIMNYETIFTIFEILTSIDSSLSRASQTSYLVQMEGRCSSRGYQRAPRLIQR
jgi:hypothetical protein